MNLRDAERLWQQQTSGDLPPAETREIKENIVKNYEEQKLRTKIWLGMGSVAWCAVAWVLLEDYFTGARSWAVWPPLFVVSMWIPLWWMVWRRVYQVRRQARACGQSLAAYAQRALAVLGIRVRFAQGVLFFALPLMALASLVRFVQKYQMGTWELSEWALRFGLAGLALTFSAGAVYWLLYKRLYPQRQELRALLTSPKHFA